MAPPPRPGPRSSTDFAGGGSTSRGPGGSRRQAITIDDDDDDIEVVPPPVARPSNLRSQARPREQPRQRAPNSLGVDAKPASTSPYFPRPTGSASIGKKVVVDLTVDESPEPEEGLHREADDSEAIKKLVRLPAARLKIKGSELLQSYSDGKLYRQRSPGRGTRSQNPQVSSQRSQEWVRITTLKEAERLVGITLPVAEVSKKAPGPGPSSDGDELMHDAPDLGSPVQRQLRRDARQEAANMNLPLRDLPKKSKSPKRNRESNGSSSTPNKRTTSRYRSAMEVESADVDLAAAEDFLDSMLPERNHERSTRSQPMEDEVDAVVAEIASRQRQPDKPGPSRKAQPSEDLSSTPRRRRRQASDVQMADGEPSSTPRRRGIQASDVQMQDASKLPIMQFAPLPEPVFETAPGKQFKKFTDWQEPEVDTKHVSKADLEVLIFNHAT